MTREFNQLIKTFDGVPVLWDGSYTRFKELRPGLFVVDGYLAIKGDSELPIAISVNLGESMIFTALSNPVCLPCKLLRVEDARKLPDDIATFPFPLFA